jgi:hypothetical protein
VGQVRGSVEHSKGKGGESAVAIPWFLCGSRYPCRLRTAQFWLWWQVLSCVLTICWVFMGLDRSNNFCNYFVKPHLPALCGAFYFWRENEAEGQDFILGTGVWFWLSRDLWMVVICESLRESSVWRVGQVLSPAGCILIRVIVTLSVMSGILPLQSSRSMFGVLLMDSRSWVWVWFGWYYHYDYCICLPFMLT